MFPLMAILAAFSPVIGWYLGKITLSDKSSKKWR